MVSLPEHLSAKPAGRHRLPREVLAEHQRERILDAATEVFAKRGYQGTTIDNVVAAARIGVGSFYELFANKSDCFVQVYERIVADARERISAAVPAGAEWQTQAIAALRVLLEQIEAEPLRARVALVEVQTAGSAALARYEETIDGVIPLLARGREVSPVAAELPPRLEEAIVGGLAWLLQRRVVLGEFEGAEAHLPDLVEIAVEPYVGKAVTASLLGGSPEVAPTAPAV